MVVAKIANTTQHGAIEGKTQTHEIDYFNLEVITSVGYRVKSKRGGFTLEELSPVRSALATLHA